MVGAIDFNFPAVVAYTTFDGGETWEGPVQTPFLRDDLVGAGDPVVRFDSEGNVFMISISLGLDDFTIGNFELTAVVSSIAIVKSEDGGLTWDDAISTSRSGVSTNLQLDLDQRARGQVFLSFLDKPWIDIGPDPEDPEKEIFYVTYTDFNVVTSVLYLDELPVLATQEVQSTIRAVTSRDGGRTWSDTVDISPTVRRISGNTPAPGTGQTTGLKRVVQGSSPKVAPDGTAYVAWMDSTDDESQEGLGEIYIARSDDGGDTWTRPMRATVFGEPGFRPRSAFFRYWASAFPQMAISPDGGGEHRVRGPERRRSGGRRGRVLHALHGPRGEFYPAAGTRRRPVQQPAILPGDGHRRGGRDPRDVGGHEGQQGAGQVSHLLHDVRGRRGDLGLRGTRSCASGPTTRG